MVVTKEFPDRERTRSATDAPMSYDLLISSIAEAHARTRAGAVNRYLTLRNWLIGAHTSSSSRVAAPRCSVECGRFTALTPN